MIIFLLVSFIVIYIITLIYYNIIKKTREVGLITAHYRSLLTLWLIFWNKISRGKLNFQCLLIIRGLHFQCKKDYDNFNTNDVVYKHEAKHIEQAKKEGIIKFYIKYLWFCIRYGYTNNPYEVEARAAEKEQKENNV